MEDSFKTIGSGGEGYYSEKRSKFLAYAHHVTSVEQIREIISETTGRVYRLGPYKRPEKKQEKTDPMQVFKNKLKESGVEVVEE